MKHIVIILFLPSVILMSCISQQQQVIRNDSVHDNINTILEDSLLTPCFIGVKIVSLSDGTILYDRNSNKMFHPASNMKLLTTATALAMLDSGFQCKTKICIDGTIQGDRLIGNLYVKGFGDPMVTNADLDSIAANLRARGITAIDGDIVGDISYFDDVFWGHGWMWDDEPDADEAFISPLTVHSNAVNVIVAAGRRPRNSLSVQIEPATSYFQIVNEGVTSNDTSLPSLQVTRNRGTNEIHITGRMSPGNPTREFSLSAYRPEMYFLNLLKERLVANGIRVDNSIRLDTIQGTTTLFQISHPLDSVLHQINKPSDNIAAENILKILGAEERAIPGTSEHGLSVIKDFLFSIGIDTTTMILADGSGVSAYNLISPDAIVRLLAYEYSNKKTFQRYYESLPIAGVDGTLQNRMRGTPAEGNVHAKTGSLTGVSTLSGYVTTSNGKFLAFSILANHYPKEIVALRTMQDRILNYLASHRGL